MGDENRGGVRHRWAALGVPGMGCLTELCYFVPRSFVCGLGFLHNKFMWGVLGHQIWLLCACVAC